MAETVILTFASAAQRTLFEDSVAQNYKYAELVQDPKNINAMIQNPMSKREFAIKIMNTFVLENIKKFKTDEVEILRQQKIKEAETAIAGLTIE